MRSSLWQHLTRYLPEQHHAANPKQKKFLPLVACRIERTQPLCPITVNKIEQINKLPSTPSSNILAAKKSSRNQRIYLHDQISFEDEYL
mgnify:CR=1 FL=1